MSRCPDCEKAARKARAEARANGELEGRPDRNGRVVHYSEEERLARSERARRLHAQGRFGGAVIGASGGRAMSRERRRITDAVLEHFRQPEKQELAIKALESALKGKSKNLRLSAYRELRQTEEKAIERERADRGGSIDPAGMEMEELEEFVIQGLTAMVERGEIAADVVLGPDDVREVE